MDANTTIEIMTERFMIERYTKGQKLERDLKILLEGGSVVKLFTTDHVVCEDNFIKKLSRDNRIITLIRMDKIVAIIA